MHNHNHCEHKINYCSQCNFTYCNKCGEEWGRRYPYYNYPSWETPFGGVTYPVGTDTTNCISPHTHV